MPANTCTKHSFWRRRGYGYPDVLRFKGSVLPSCIPIIFCSTSFATIVTVLYLVYHINLLLPGSLIGSVAVVVGLLLGFSTNNAYDRYYEGQKLFTNICTNTRNCTRLIWSGVKERNEEDRHEKEKNIKLLLAYVVAVKHHLRLEFDDDCSDLAYLLPKNFNLSNFDCNVTQKNDVPGNDDPNSSQQSNIPDSMKSTFRSLASRVSPTTYKLIKHADESVVDVDASMSLPLEIIYRLGLYFSQKNRENKLDNCHLDILTSKMNALIEILGDLERIGNTPIPFAYNVHLKQVVTLYVWILPFTLVDELKWLTIPVIMMISFVLFGVLAIGAEIENPFGYDENDLPLDEICKNLEAEVKYVQKYLPTKSNYD